MKKAVIYSLLFHLAFFGLVFSIPAFRNKIIIVEEIFPINIITAPAEPSPRPARKAPPPKKPEPAPRKSPPKVPVQSPIVEEKLPEILPRAEPPPMPEISLKEKIKKRLETQEARPIEKTEIEEEPTEEPRRPPELPQKASQAPAQSLVLEASDFPYAWYVAVIKNKIFQNWTPPGRIPMTHPGVGTYVKFLVARDGKITGIEIKQSSGYTLIDRSALEAVKAVKDLPPLPKDYKEEHLNVVVFFQPAES